MTLRRSPKYIADSLSGCSKSELRYCKVKRLAKKHGKRQLVVKQTMFSIFLQLLNSRTQTKVTVKEEPFLQRFELSRQNINLHIEY